MRLRARSREVLAVAGGAKSVMTGTRSRPVGVGLGRAERVDRVDRVERVDKVEMVERVERVERVDRKGR